jgi:Oligosaccaryltransferase
MHTTVSTAPITQARATHLPLIVRSQVSEVQGLERRSWTKGGLKKDHRGPINHRRSQQPTFFLKKDRNASDRGCTFVLPPRYLPICVLDFLCRESVTESTSCRPMITHTTLSSIANSLGAMAVFLIVVYHILAVNARHLEAVEAQSEEK